MAAGLRSSHRYNQDEPPSDSTSSEYTHPDFSISGTTHPDCIRLGTTRLVNWNNQTACPKCLGNSDTLLCSGFPAIEAACTASQLTASRNRLNDTPAGENRRQKKKKRRPSSTQEDETLYGNAIGNDNNNNNTRKLLKRSSRRSLKQNQPDESSRCSEGSVTLRGDSVRLDGAPSLIKTKRSAKSFPLNDYQTHCCLVLTSALRETVSCDRIVGVVPKTKTTTLLQKTLSQTHFCRCGCSPSVVVECSTLPPEIVQRFSQEDVSDNMATAGPNADQGFPVLFEDERQSDVVLLVGAEGFQERIPAHSWVLGHNNDYFRTLLTGPLRDPTIKEFYFNEDQPRGFRSFIRWLYGCGCVPKDTQSALDTLQVAFKYLAVDLVEHVVTHLSKNLHPENVLQIMAWCQYTSNSRLAPSAPPVEEIEPQEDLPPPYPGTAPPPPYEAIYDCDPTISCHLLVSECFSLLDVKADQVLASESLEEVSASLLSAVLSRNTLGVTSEGPVLDALYRWSSAECRRQHLPLTLEGRRRVLGQMLTLPRLLTVSVSQLTVLDKLYEQNEINFITSKVKGDSCVASVPPIFVGFLEQIAKKRVPPTVQNNKNKKDKQKNSSKKRFSTKQLMWDIFSVFAHMID